jgi:nucleotide-binding universal stress UspA family protein
VTQDGARIVVGVDGSPGADAALAWALDEARSLHCDVHLVYAYGDAYTDRAVEIYGRLPVPELEQVSSAARMIVDRAADRATELAPQVRVSIEAVGAPPARALLTEAERASRIVLGSRGLKTFGSAVLGSVGAAVAARAACPAIVVRGPAGLVDERAAVVVGVDASPRSAPVLEFAFDYASRHALPLRPVLCWHRDVLTEIVWSPETPAPPRAEEWLSEALAGWREQYPDVAVHPGVVRDHPAAGLLAAAAAQHLLVVGTRGEHALVGTLLGSVTQAMLHHATCPVAVIPRA